MLVFNLEIAKYLRLHKKALYPVFQCGNFRGVLDIAEVQPHCPMLMSKNVMKKWNVDMCFGTGCLNIHKFGVTIPFNECDVPTVGILDVTQDQLNRTMRSGP